MTETAPSRAFDDSEPLDWLRSQPDGRVTASAAELGRQWGWNRMRAVRRLRAWQEAGYLRRNTDEIIVTTSVTPSVTAAVGVTAMPESTVARRSMTPVKLAVLIVALALACVSATISIHGLTAIFAGAFCIGGRSRHDRPADDTPPHGRHRRSRAVICPAACPC
jgi:hypothetical protein